MAKVNLVFVFDRDENKQCSEFFILGGKGLGKGGAKRHRKVLRDNIQGKLIIVECPQH